MCAVMRRSTSVDAPQAGPEGFVELYERTVADVYSYLASRVGERGAAEDLTQDVFIVGAHRAANGDPVDLPWLIGVARHKLIDHWRAKGRQDRNLTLVRSATQTRPADEPDVFEPGPASLVLAGLNPTYRAALVLRHVDGLTVASIADHLGRSVEATEQILSRARATFRVNYRGLTNE